MIYAIAYAKPNRKWTDAAMITATSREERDYVANLLEETGFKSPTLVLGGPFRNMGEATKFLDKCKLLTRPT